MALIDQVPGAREWLPVARKKGLTYEAYAARLLVAGMPPEVAATKPLGQRTRPKNSIRAACEDAGICRRTLYNHLQTLREMGIDPDPFDIIEVLKS